MPWLPVILRAPGGAGSIVGMTDTIGQVRGVLGVVRFVILWLCLWYAHDMVAGAFEDFMREWAEQLLGWIAAVVAVVFLWWSRRQATAAGAEPKFGLLWRSAPAIIFIVPILLWLIVFLITKKEQTWGEWLWAMMPVMLGRGVPVLVLGWVYFRLGGIAGPDGGADEGEEQL